MLEHEAKTTENGVGPVKLLFGQGKPAPLWRHLTRTFRAPVSRGTADTRRTLPIGVHAERAISPIQEGGFAALTRRTR